jgi:TPR repeat protein
MDPALRAAMLRRGQSLIAIGDISGARLFLERAALGGSSEAAMALAETYDPGRLVLLGVIGLPADPAAALSWYRRAHALGAPEAAARIATLEGPR